MKKQLSNVAQKIGKQTEVSQQIVNLEKKTVENIEQLNRTLPILQRQAIEASSQHSSKEYGKRTISHSLSDPIPVSPLARTETIEIFSNNSINFSFDKLLYPKFSLITSE